MMVVSVGAGKNQIPLIKACKDLGCKVIGIDRNIHAEGLRLCEFKIIESIHNYHEIFDLLKELLLFDDIAAIISRSHGEAIKTVAFLCHQLKLPFIDFTNVDNLIHKSLFRTIANNNNITMPRGAALKKSTLKKSTDVPFPCIVKPSKGYAKNNVKLIYSSRELKEYASSIKHDEIIVEEYIDGDEIIVIGFVYNKKFFIADISDKILNAKPYFVDRMHILPSKYYSRYSQLQQLGQRITDAFLLHTTPLLMECIIKNNDIYLIEAACEFGGEFLADYAIPARLNYNIFRAFAKAIITNTVDMPSASENACVVKYIMGRKGKLASYSIPTSTHTHAELFAKVGDSISFPKNNHHRVGVIVSKGKTIDNAMKKADTVLDQMKLIIE